jgi:hypothetical protein
MFTPTTALVRRRSGPNLSKVPTVPQAGSTPGTVVLQMLFGELTSMKEQLNALVARPAPIQPATVGPTGQQSSAGPSGEVEPTKLRRMFD